MSWLIGVFVLGDLTAELREQKNPKKQKPLVQKLLLLVGKR